MFLLFTAWAVIQVVLLLMSITFFVYGVRNIFDRTILSVVLIAVSIYTFINIYDSLVTIIRAVF